MKTTVQKCMISTLDCDVEFEGLTLLSGNEYEEYKHNIPMSDFWWWLRSKTYKNAVLGVSRGGSLCSSKVYYPDGCVRPVMILKSCNFNIGDVFRYDNHYWVIISEKYALCDDSFCDMKFRADWEAEDANDYDASDIKKYLDEQFERMKACIV